MGLESRQNHFAISMLITQIQLIEIDKRRIFRDNIKNLGYPVNIIINFELLIVLYIRIGIREG